MTKNGTKRFITILLNSKRTIPGPLISGFIFVRKNVFLVFCGFIVKIDKSLSGAGGASDKGISQLFPKNRKEYTLFTLYRQYIPGNEWLTARQ